MLFAKKAFLASSRTFFVNNNAFIRRHFSQLKLLRSSQQQSAPPAPVPQSSQFGNEEVAKRIAEVRQKEPKDMTQEERAILKEFRYSEGEKKYMQNFVLHFLQICFNRFKRHGQTSKFICTNNGCLGGYWYHWWLFWFLGN